MKVLALGLLLLIVVLDAGSVLPALSATVTLPPKTTAQPPPSTQSAPKLTGPGIVRPPTTGNAPPPNYVGPTENLTQVANAMSLHALSLTVQVSFVSGLNLTKPVCVTVFFDSYSGSAYPTYSNVLFQTYDATNGNRFSFNDQEASGKPRQATLRIQLFEPATGGCGGRVLGTGFDLPDLRINLDPLYDVSIGPIAFTPQNNCALWASSQIRVRWFSPDDQAHEASLHWTGVNTQYVAGSQWTASEVSASANYHVPRLGFYASIPSEPSVPSNINLIPAPAAAPTWTPLASQQINTPVVDLTNQCRGEAGYVISRQLKRYPSPLIEPVAQPLRAK